MTSQAGLTGKIKKLGLKLKVPLVFVFLFGSAKIERSAITVPHVEPVLQPPQGTCPWTLGILPREEYFQVCSGVLGFKNPSKPSKKMGHLPCLGQWRHEYLACRLEGRNRDKRVSHCWESHYHESEGWPRPADRMRCGNKDGANKYPVATLTIQKRRTQRVDLPRGPRRRKGAQGLGLERDAKI